ncbi:oligosaccharide flippase family protein [Burkholderia sp. RS01]|uniref:oligosaccharide flippase family protein n=1 Tax=unclassified Burkholderia TaxID=2613784 RepID=UPI0032184C2B
MGKSLLTRVVVFPVTALAALVTTSIVVQSAGGLLFGIIALISTLVQLVPFADLGLGAAVVNEISSTTDASRRKAVLYTATKRLLIPMVVVLLAAPMGSTFFSWATLLGVTGTSPHEVDMVTSIVVAIFGLSIPFGLGQRVLVGLGKNHIAVALALVTSLTALSLTWLISITPANPVFLAVCPAAASLVAAATTYILAWRMLGTEGISSNFRSIKIGGLFRQATPMIVIMIGIPLAFQTHRILLSLRSGPLELSEYSLTMQFYLPLWSFISVAATSLWPVFSRGRSSGEAQGKKVLHSALILCSLGTMFALLLTFFGSWLGGIVSQGKIELGSSVLMASAVLLFVQSLQQVPGMFLTDTSGLWFQAICIVILSIWTLAAGWLTAPYLGAAGPLLATASGVLLFQIVPGYVRVAKILRGKTTPESVKRGRSGRRRAEKTSSRRPVGVRSRQSVRID